MWTYTGKRFWPMDPHPDDVCIEDIAHALSLLARFAGHTFEPYSVAQHCWMVSKLCDPPDALDGLMHDSAEAYVTDMPRPLKHSPGLEAYRTAEDRVHMMIANKFGFKAEVPESVLRADELVVEAEMRDLMPPMPLEIRESPGRLIARQPGVAGISTITAWPWRVAEQMFMARWHELRR